MDINFINFIFKLGIRYQLILIGIDIEGLDRHS